MLKNLKVLNQLVIIIQVLSKYIKKVRYINDEIILDLKSKEDLIFFVTFLKKHYKLQYNILLDIVTVDYLRKKENLNYKRFVINYLFLSFKYKTRVRLSILLKENELIDSLTILYKSANWLERENWDLFGIFFKNHFDLRRILTDYGFEGFPFRKDFPLSGYLELRYDDEKRVLVYEKLELAQEFRFFEFKSPWEISYYKT